MGVKEGLSHKVLNGSLWQFSAKLSQALVNLVVQMILARILMPQDFALLAVCIVFIEISELLVDGGFASSLIQKDSLDATDLDTVFYANLIIALLLFFLIALNSPFISKFFNFDMLAPILISLSLGIPISALGNVQNALLQKDFKFKARMKVSLIATLLSGICSVTFALLSFGVWALVIGQLANRVIYAGLLTMLARYKPAHNFSVARLKSLWNFGFAVLISNLISIIQRQAPVFFIAKAYPASELGYVSMAQKIDKTASVSFEGSLTQVLFPAFSSIQKDFNRFSQAFFKAFTLGNFIFIPLMSALILIAPDLILFLFGEKWVFAGPYLQAISFFTLSLFSYNIYKQACLALSLSRQALIADLIVLALSIIAMLLVLPYGIIWIFIVQFPIRILGIAYQHIQINKHISFSFERVAKPLALTVLATLVTVFVLFALSQINQINTLPIILKLVFQLIVGVISYLICVKLFMPKELKSLFTLFKSIKA